MRKGERKKGASEKKMKRERKKEGDTGELGRESARIVVHAQCR